MFSLAQSHIECAHCGNQELQQIPGVWSPLVLTQEGQVPGPAVPVVMLACPQCGFIQMFSPQRVQPAPFPETQPAEPTEE